jgi:hypothetical protein
VNQVARLTVAHYLLIVNSNDVGKPFEWGEGAIRKWIIDKEHRLKPVLSEEKTTPWKP